MNTIAVVGSINVDLFSYLDRWPNVGETIAVRQTSITLGGKGANQAAAAARLGARTEFIGGIGTDSFGANAKQDLEKLGVSVRLTELEEYSTGLAFIDVGPEGDNLIRIASGANGALKAAHLAPFEKILTQCDVLLLQNEVSISVSMKAASMARKGGALVIMDPAPAPNPAWTPQQLASFDILTPNAHEAGSLLGTVPKTLDEARRAADELVRTYNLQGAIVTMGELGGAWQMNGRSETFTAPFVQCLDTVAAGDCFNGALAASLAAGADISEAVSLAAHAAALATTKQGASSSLPSLEELNRFYPPASGLFQWIVD
ncbi:ribokinase [Flexibacterium corallicola]|uniref:ribokinase n=1 Tax=Flexibacterium corallicola TaxID=3037259 RepID=UPI00286F9818|nr:ribokinase [Pseudovibrio sp. M1P-2-3]